MDVLRSLWSIYDQEIIALLLTWPRIHGFLATSQIFTATSVPRLSRTATVFVLCLPVLPVNFDYALAIERTPPVFALHFAKEYVIGFLLGYLVGWIFWVVQSAGAFIDNQRGAAIASSVDPLHGHETSPIGNMFSQVFLTYLFITGAVLPIFGLLYASYGAWPADRTVPLISDQFPKMLLLMFDHAFRLMFVLAAPIIAIMFMAEFALAMVSRFAPQIQVFILAMPIKSALAIFVLIFYFSILMPYSAKQMLTIPGMADTFYNMLKAGEKIRQLQPPGGTVRP
ncbi:type III secretion system export apparatus subunit SctT [Prosthecomicrobium hirschii]|uniref:Type III secretion system protein n=1 Tax=Prosthecodimorpha hirschii TaxID=665126 RepID=A0A0P6VJD1_9HYPH|nr:type III secretion system export apparatus subunit SctT [Prosthecomicrobium hirschii]KPL52131.1 hypothetical protein ABB55_07735 [Prosthecomicrobium hirschii]MCW1843485.1 type III secretion system export apparatus subunit SctT [Prosthecomicrobium hirschii]TPQ48665.1 EscT/YscT/HrcT family type III secretion system export apparatus protein [Prosthecomicrobium hirschii]